jgi:hypothetical protein
MSTWILIYTTEDKKKVLTLAKAMGSQNYHSCSIIYNHILEELEDKNEKKLLELENKKEVSLIKENWGIETLPALVLTKDQTIEKIYYEGDLFVDDQLESQFRHLW